MPLAASEGLCLIRWSSYQPQYAPTPAAAAPKPSSDRLSADRREHASAVFRFLDLKRAGSFDPQLLQLLCEKAGHQQLAQRTHGDSRSARR